jgi:hypothetical protein
MAREDPHLPPKGGTEVIVFVLTACFEIAPAGTPVDLLPFAVERL